MMSHQMWDRIHVLLFKKGVKFGVTVFVGEEKVERCDDSVLDRSSS